MLEPCAVKVASTVLRRGLHREMGFLSDNSQEEYEEQFESESGHGLEYMKLEEWFYASAQKHNDVIGWWLDLEEE